MTSKDIRKKYLEFFKKEGHAIIPSAPLIPENDPTTLFTSSGMQPLVPFLMGEPHPAGKRLVNSQRSFRAEDIEETGDNRHTTFFEMLGNWSLGDYFKKEQLPWFFEFLTKEVGLDPNKLYVTVFAGDELANVEKDDEAVSIWKESFSKVGIDAKLVDIGSTENGSSSGMQGGRIFSYNAKKNWWSRSGTPDKMPVGEIGGPDSEVFYDFGTLHDVSFGKECHPNCDCGRFIEIGNSVFMEYRRTEKGFERLPQRNVDFGGGLERTLAAALNTSDIFTTDLFFPAIKYIENQSGKKYEGDLKSAMRIIVDHMRASTQMISDGVLPSNSDQGYILRRLIRRAVRYADKLGLSQGTLSTIVPLVIAPFEGVYDEVLRQKDLESTVIATEETRFRETLSRG
ncbi:MAG: alanine--tRNA ligase-related protein, partial [Candidatus Paceibacterota bacterium]